MLHLKYRSTTTIPVEAECLTPDNLAGKSAAEVAALPVQHGNAQAPLGDFFTVEGDAADGEVVIEGDCRRVKWVGAGMTTGSTVEQIRTWPDRIRDVRPETVREAARKWLELRRSVTSRLLPAAPKTEKPS